MIPERDDEVSKLETAITHKDALIKELQEDLHRSHDYCESLQNMASKYEDYVTELQKLVEMPCGECGKVAVMITEAEQPNVTQESFAECVRVAP